MTHQEINDALAALQSPEYLTFNPIIPNWSYYPDAGVCKNCRREGKVCRWHELKELQRMLESQS